MHNGWALCLPVAAAKHLAALRLSDDLEIADVNGLLWLRGKTTRPDLAVALWRLPANARFHWLAGDRLQPWGSRLASERLPQSASWQSLRTWLRVGLPAAGLPADNPRPRSLRIVPSDRATEPNAMLLPMSDWLSWAVSAPLIRLNQLRYAISGRGDALILGRPVPPVRGQLLVETDGVVIPVGAKWDPAVPPRVVRRVLAASDGMVVLWDIDGARLLSEELFVPATRASARASQRAWEGAAK